MRGIKLALLGNAIILMVIAYQTMQNVVTLAFAFAGFCMTLLGLMLYRSDDDKKEDE